MKIKSIIIPVLAMTVLCSCSSLKSSTLDPQDEEVRMAYGNVSRDSNAFSVSEDKVTEADENFTNIFDYLRSKVPGVYISPDNGSGGIPSIQVRGQKSIHDSNEPLILVDGSEHPDLMSIRPEEIYSVQVLKDAAASSYGSRGANGVIMFTTKFAHDTEERERMERKAERDAAKEARKNR